MLCALDRATSRCKAGKQQLKDQNQMRNIHKFAIAALLGVAIASPVFAQGRRGGPPAGAGGGVAFLAAAYARIVQFDSDNDGLLDENEQADLSGAIASGEVQAPGGMGPPAGVNPGPEQIAERIAVKYAVMAPYDANADRTIDATEQAAIQADIMSGKLRRPGGRPN
jgi:hypothetical protein